MFSIILSPLRGWVGALLSVWVNIHFTSSGFWFFGLIVFYNSCTPSGLGFNTEGVVFYRLSTIHDAEPRRVTPSLGLDFLEGDPVIIISPLRGDGYNPEGVKFLWMKKFILKGKSQRGDIFVTHKPNKI